MNEDEVIKTSPSSYIPRVDPGILTSINVAYSS